MNKKRICWDEHHMQLAMVSAKRSPDPNTKVGACVIDEKNRPLSLGYNGTARGINPCQVPWQREAEIPENTKYPWVIHAERNAINNRNCSLEGATIYVTMHPCHECAKDIIQAGIKEVVYWKNPYENTWSVRVARRMFEIVDMTIRQYNPEESS